MDLGIDLAVVPWRSKMCQGLEQQGCTDQVMALEQPTVSGLNPQRGV